MLLRALMILSLLLILPSCQYWDWRTNGHNILVSACESLGNCTVGP